MILHILIGCFQNICLFFIIKRKHAVSYVRENNPPAKHYGWIFSCITILVFLVMSIIFAALAFQEFEG